MHRIQGATVLLLLVNVAMVYVDTHIVPPRYLVTVWVRGLCHFYGGTSGNALVSEMHLHPNHKIHYFFAVILKVSDAVSTLSAVCPFCGAPVTYCI